MVRVERLKCSLVSFSLTRGRTVCVKAQGGSTQNIESHMSHPNHHNQVSFQLFFDIAIMLFTGYISIQTQG